MTHPRSPLDYGEEKLEQARNSWSRLFNALSQLPEESHGPTPASLALGARFAESLGDDLNTPEALSVIFEAVSEWHRGDDVAVAYWAKRALETLGFDLTPVTAGDALTPALLELLIQVRQEARERRDFRTSDLIRERLKTIGVVLEDGIDGARWKIER